jgi:hypothetical protein
MNFRTAVPALVNCAVPRRWISSQYVAAASQNFTLPAVNAVSPALTAAVSVTMVFDATDVTGVPDAVTFRVVEVVAGAPLTVTAREVAAVRAPDVPVIVTVAFPNVAVLLAVSVSWLVPDVGFGFHDAVTPLGSPVAAKLTLPLNPNCGITVMVDLSEPPGTRFTLLGALESVKAGALIVSASVVLAFRLPEVPVMVTVAAPGVAALLAVSVSKLEPVEVGFGTKAAITPAGSPDAARLTLPLNPYSGVKKMVVVPEPPSLIVRLFGES